MPSITFTSQNTNVQDTYILETSTSGYGEDSHIEVSNNPNYIRRSLIKFDIKAIPSNVVIEKATLRLTLPYYPSKDRKIGVHLITQDWNNNITWNTQPNFKDVQEFCNVKSTDRVVEVPVTSIVQEWVNGTENHGFLLSDQTPNPPHSEVISIYSLDYSVYLDRPSLTIHYKNPNVSYMGLVKMGTLRNKTKVIPRPTLPWNPGGEPFSGCGYGNIPEFTSDWDISNWNIGDTDTSEANQLYWHKIIEGSKTILICDRVILTSISWNDLNGGNRVFGKKITIDGKTYKLRLLTCGYDRRTDFSGGYPQNNEWDRYILNDDSISGLPKPESSDRDHTFNSTDKYSKHNQFWNWFGIYTLGQETYINHKENRAVRGYGRAPDWSTAADVTIVSHMGWRPVLEVLNQPPTLSLKTPYDNQTLTESNVFKIEGTVSDNDKDNVVVTKYRINNSTTRAIASGVSDGSSPISFAKSLLFQNKRLYDGTTDITGSDLAENIDHILTIWAEDDQGGKSTEVTRKFRVVHNRPPVITGQNKDLGIIEAAPSETYSVTDPEGDSFTVVEKINGTVIRSFPGVADREETATIPPDIWLTLQPDVVHTLTVTATDKQGMMYTRSYTFKRFENKIVIDGLAVPFTTDIAAKRVLITPDWVIPFGTVVKVETCNNAFDESPTWEDCTLVVKLGRGYLYTNDKKTADKWGIDIRFHIEKGEATKPISIQGFGGAFD
ncbi:DNRLRE domain-containing protein [Brevibacillus sp. VP]|uniref:DNRLRE domain-containing protein n=1 Tax=Brevibacillus sp. VP TaxID=2293326 RepID=UPI0011C04800|nr:DNRLRE domain-containing protein [Brevibacillus sp. VP]